MARKPTHMWALFDADCRTSNERLVLMALVTLAQKHGAAWPAQSTVCRLTRLSRSSVARALRGLEDRGLIERALEDQQRGQSVRWRFPHAQAVPLPRSAEPVDFQDRADLAKRRLRAYERKLAQRAG